MSTRRTSTRSTPRTPRGGAAADPAADPNPAADPAADPDAADADPGTGPAADPGGDAPRSGRDGGTGAAGRADATGRTRQGKRPGGRKPARRGVGAERSGGDGGSTGTGTGTRTGTGDGDGASAARPRSLAADLRARGDSALHRLLRARPDLTAPVPTDLTQLATRAATRASVLRALEQLDRFTLQVAEVFAVLPDGTDADTAARLLVGRPDAAPAAAARTGTGTAGPSPDAASGDGRATAAAPADSAAVAAALPRALATLRDRALLWGATDDLHLVRTARDLLGPSPVSAPHAAARLATAGLGPAAAECAPLLTPSRVQEILADVGLPGTPDGVSGTAALGALFSDPARLDGLLADAPPAALGALRELVWGPPTGAVEDAERPVRAAAARTGVEWLLARGLLLPCSSAAVLLPREVAVHLRGGRAHRVVEPEPPVPEGPAREPATTDRTAAGQAFTALRTVEELLESWDTGGPPVLRAGGIGVRELRRSAAALEATEPQAAFWLELAYGAGLIAPDGEADEIWAPTPGYDVWLERSPAERWAQLAAAWLAATRLPGLTGSRDAKGRPMNALGAELNRAAAPEVRRGVLAALAAAGPGAAPSAEGLAALLRWQRPLRGGGAVSPDEPAVPLRDALVRWTVEEAEQLGVTGRGALSAHGRALLGADAARPGGEAPAAGGPRSATAAEPATPAEPATERAAEPETAAGSAEAAGAAAARLAPLLPAPLDAVLLQADLTAVAPGPLTRDLARRLALAADVESTGGATVYRFTPESVRRALDAGMSAADLREFLAAHSSTPVPQPLAYLVDDVARRHGRLRVGTAGAYLRCDDDALLAELLADRRAAPLGLRRLAPTVLAARSAPDTVVERLRVLGYAPAAESAAGEVLIARQDARRTGPRRAPEPVREGPEPPDELLLDAAVRAVRAGDDAAAAAPAPAPDAPSGAAARPPRSSSAETLAAVQAAVLTGGQLLIGYVDPEGHATRRVIEPARVDGGHVRAYDHLSDTVRTFALHRVTGTTDLDPDR